MGSILLDRGDRIAFMGDDHLSIKVAMYAFGEFEFVKQSIIETQNNTDNILSYPLYWTQSIYDYYLLTNDTSLLKQLDSMIQYYLNQSIAVFGTNPATTYMDGMSELVQSLSLQMFVLKHNIYIIC